MLYDIAHNLKLKDRHLRNISLTFLVVTLKRQSAIALRTTSCDTAAHFTFLPMASGSIQTQPPLTLFYPQHVRAVPAISQARPLTGNPARSPSRAMMRCVSAEPNAP